MYMKMRDALGTMYQDESFAHVFPQNGRPVEAPWRLAFLTVVQFIEGLPDRQAAAELIGRDGSNLLVDIYEASAPAFLREIPAVQILRRIWIQNYVWVEGQLHWRSNDNLPPGKDFINSPYDQEARYGKKRETRWTGDIRPS